MRFDASSAKARTGTQQAFQKALDVSDAKSADLYNNIGYIETVNKDYADADRNLHDARASWRPRTRSSWPAAPNSPPRGATRPAPTSSSTRPSTSSPRTARTSATSSSSPHCAATSATSPAPGSPVSAVSDFFLKGREAEASIGALGSITPGDTHGAHITGLILKTSDTKLGEIAKFVTIGFTYSNLAVGDHISLRFYANGVTYDPIASIPDTVVASNSTLVGSGVEQPDSHFRLGLSNTGETTMEVYLNGVSQGEVSINIPPG